MTKNEIISLIINSSSVKRNYSLSFEDLKKNELETLRRVYRESLTHANITVTIEGNHIISIDNTFCVYDLYPNITNVTGSIPVTNKF